MFSRSSSFHSPPSTTPKGQGSPAPAQRVLRSLPHWFSHLLRYVHMWPSTCPRSLGSNWDPSTYRTGPGLEPKQSRYTINVKYINGGIKCMKLNHMSV